MTTFKIFLFILLSAFFNTLTYANVCEEKPEALHAAFEKAYFNQYSQPDYFEGWCPNNIYNLSVRLRNAGIDLTNAEVWYLHRRDSDGSLGMIYPKYPRTSAGLIGWVFHVVLHLDGLILDMDYSTEPTFEPLEEYFDKMFPESLGKNQNLLVKIAPAEEFLRDYLAKYAQNPRFFLTAATNDRYPPGPLSEAIELSHSKFICKTR